MSTSFVVLNADMKILHEVGVKRAISLINREVVEPVGNMFIKVKTHTGEITIPRIMKLKRFIQNVYNKKATLNLNNIFIRDDGRCAYCNKRMERRDEMTIDHVVPKSRGGEHTWENCVLSCKKCNHTKENNLLSEIDMKLRGDINLFPVKISSILDIKTRKILKKCGLNKEIQGE